MKELRLQVGDGEVRFEVHAKPRAAKSAIKGVREGRLDVSLAAPPVDGAANDALVELLARALGVPRRAVELRRGSTGREKLVAVLGLPLEAVREALARAEGR